MKFFMAGIDPKSAFLPNLLGLHSLIFTPETPSFRNGAGCLLPVYPMPRWVQNRRHSPETSYCRIRGTGLVVKRNAGATERAMAWSLTITMPLPIIAPHVIGMPTAIIAAMAMRMPWAMITPMEATWNRRGQWNRQGENLKRRLICDRQINGHRGMGRGKQIDNNHQQTPCICQ